MESEAIEGGNLVLRLKCGAVTVVMASFILAAAEKHVLSSLANAISENVHRAAAYAESSPPVFYEGEGSEEDLTTRQPDGPDCVGWGEKKMENDVTRATRKIISTVSDAKERMREALGPRVASIREDEKGTAFLDADGEVLGTVAVAFVGPNVQIDATIAGAEILRREYVSIYGK